MMKLESTSVYRGGQTARKLSHETKDVWLDTEDAQVGTEGGIPKRLKYLKIEFAMKSKGSGTTEVELRIRPPDFTRLVQMMVAADRQAAMVAMSEEVARQINDQPSLDAKNVVAGRQSVTDLAQRKADTSRGDDAEMRMFVERSVRKLIDELNEVDARPS